MSQADVRALIEARLADWASQNDLPVAYENVAFDPPAGEFLKFNLLPARTGSDDMAGAHRS